MGEVTSRCAARDQLDGWGTGTGNFDRGPVKSHEISQELLQDLPTGESRIQLSPDKDHGAELGLQSLWSRPYGVQGGL
jgi:hypothetical protein